MDQIKIGKFIASCRKEQGMTQAALAEKLGISYRAVSKWETAKSLPDAGIMLELCEILPCKTARILHPRQGGDESPGERKERTNVRKNSCPYAFVMV